MKVHKGLEGLKKSVVHWTLACPGSQVRVQVWNASLRPAIVGAAAAPRVLKLTLPRGVEAKRSQGQGLREMVHLAVAEGIASCARNFSAPSSEMARALGEAKAQLAAAAQLEKERLQVPRSSGSTARAFLLVSIHSTGQYHG